MMTTREAIGIVAAGLKEETAIATTGFTGRDLQACGDRSGNFYMIGSMGLAASLGLGLAVSRPGTPVVVFDGDGSALMGLGGLATVAALRPKNLTHVVFDNEAFVSTGRQPTCSAQVALEKVALACGYPVVRRAETLGDLAAAWGEVRSRPGPSFLLVKCEPDPGEPAPRVRAEPEAITIRFMEAVNASSQTA